MPRLLLPVPETIESVLRPVILDITRQLFERTGLPANTAITFPGDLDKVKQPGSTFSPTGDINTMPFYERISIEVEENFEMERLASTAIFRPENLFIFRDDRIETSIKPAYSSTDTTINFRYRAVDKVAAMRWRDDIRTRVSMNRDVMLHDITYHYLIPPEFLVILKELHRMRESVAGYGETYNDYFTANVTQRASELTTLAGTQAAWGISEKQMRIVGWFDFDGVPELGSKEDEGDTWTVSFSYKFKYDKPIACVMFYPLMVHNQLVDQKFRPSEPVYSVEAHVRSYSLSAKNFSMFEMGRQQLDVPQGLAIPDFDEFIPASVPSRTLRVLTALTSIDIAMPRFLLSLKELGEVELHPAILEFLVGEAPFMTKPLQSVFNLNFYSNTNLLPNNAISISSDMNVFSLVDLPLRNYYHVRLSLNKDFDTLNPAALERLRKHGIALCLILKALDPTSVCPPFITNGGDLGSGRLGANNQVTKETLKKVIDILNRVDLAKGDGQIRQFNTVEVLFIQSQLNHHANS